MKVTPKELLSRQNMPLDYKVQLSLHRIREWCELHNGMVYVAFSGGKDSTVLLHLVRFLYPEVPAVFCNTGLEFPEIIQFVRTVDNVIWLRPEMTFEGVIEKYGWPVSTKENAQRLHELRTTKSDRLRDIRLNGYGNKYNSGKLAYKWRFLMGAPFKVSHKCCDIMKKRPARKYEKETGRKCFTGEMANDSAQRRQRYIASGCNSFNTKRPISRPIGFWTEKDIWEYIKKFNVPYSPIYDMRYDRTGCVFCLFGLDKERKKTGSDRFEKMQKTHPKLWQFGCKKYGLDKVLDFVNKKRGKMKESIEEVSQE